MKISNDANLSFVVRFPVFNPHNLFFFVEKRFNSQSFSIQIHHNKSFKCLEPKTQHKHILSPFNQQSGESKETRVRAGNDTFYCQDCVQLRLYLCCVQFKVAYRIQRDL